MKRSKEWDMVIELAEYINDLKTDAQEKFVKDMYHNLDPYEPFLDQCSQKQKDYLYILHDFYVNKNEEAFMDLD